MKLTVTEDLGIQLEEVFSGLILKTPSGETMSICMRDNGFEFNYQGEWYFAKEGKVGSSKVLSANLTCPSCGSTKSISNFCPDGWHSNKGPNEITNLP